jgi:hypothetical protein
MSSVAKDPGVSSILLFSGSGINFPRPLYFTKVKNKKKGLFQTIIGNKLRKMAAAEPSHSLGAGQAMDDHTVKALYIFILFWKYTALSYIQHSRKK